MNNCDCKLLEAGILILVYVTKSEGNAHTGQSQCMKVAEGFDALKLENRFCDC